MGANQRQGPPDEHVFDGKKEEDLPDDISQTFLQLQKQQILKAIQDQLEKE